MIAVDGTAKRIFHTWCHKQVLQFKLCRLKPRWLIPSRRHLLIINQLHAQVLALWQDLKSLAHDAQAPQDLCHAVGEAGGGIGGGEDGLIVAGEAQLAQGSVNSLMKMRSRVRDTKRVRFKDIVRATGIRKYRQDGLLQVLFAEGVEAATLDPIQELVGAMILATTELFEGHAGYFVILEAFFWEQVTNESVSNEKLQQEYRK